MLKSNIIKTDDEFNKFDNHNNSITAANEPNKSTVVSTSTKGPPSLIFTLKVNYPLILLL